MGGYEMLSGIARPHVRAEIDQFLRTTHLEV